QTCALPICGSTLAASMTQNLSTTGSPSFSGLTDTGLTASTLLASDALKKLQSVTISNTANGTNFSFAGSTLTCDMKQNLSTSGSPSFTGATISGISNSLVNASITGALQGTTISNTQANGVQGTLSFTAGNLSLLVSADQNLGTSGSPSFVSETLTKTSNHLVLGTTNTTIINAPAPSSNITLTLPNTADTIVGRATTDTLTNKTLSSGTISGTTTLSGLTTNQLLAVDGSNHLIAVTSDSTPTFTSAALTNATNQLVLSGPTRTATISAVQPSGSSRIYTFPDV